jgi:hypothetical protein
MPKKIGNMKSVVKQKHIGFTLVIIGIVLLSTMFVSYLMDNPFVSTIFLPAGLILFITGVIISNVSGKGSQKLRNKI